MRITRDDALEAFRARVLSALDLAAIELFDPPRGRQPGSQPGVGATDADLPRLFRAIDAQVEVLAQRYCVTLED